MTLDGEEWLQVGMYYGRIVGKRFIEVFEGGFDRFDEGIFLKTVEKIDVFSGEIKVCLLDGSVVECDEG